MEGASNQIKTFLHESQHLFTGKRAEDMESAQSLGSRITTFVTENEARLQQDPNARGLEDMLAGRLFDVIQSHPEYESAFNPAIEALKPREGTLSAVVTEHFRAEHVTSEGVIFSDSTQLVLQKTRNIPKTQKEHQALRKAVNKLLDNKETLRGVPSKQLTETLEKKVFEQALILKGRDKPMHVDNMWQLARHMKKVEAAIPRALEKLGLTDTVTPQKALETYWGANKGDFKKLVKYTRKEVEAVFKAAETELRPTLEEILSQLK